MTDPPLVPVADWSYQLGQAFLTAARSCDVVCGRMFVADSARIESPSPSAGCDCQLAVIVSEGWVPVQGDRAGCSAQRVAEVRLVLDLCTLVAGPNQVLNPADVSAQAQKNATIRWGIMRGLRAAWQRGDLSVVGEPPVGPLAQAMCRRIIPDRWRAMSSSGGSGRWESVWQFHDHE